MHNVLKLMIDKESIMSIKRFTWRLDLTLSSNDWIKRFKSPFHPIKKSQKAVDEMDTVLESIERIKRENDALKSCLDEHNTQPFESLIKN